MSKFKFKSTEGLNDFIVNNLGTDLILPESTSPEVVEFFSNGDRMAINVKSGDIDWDPLNSGSLTTSKLSLRLHQWFSKGLIKEA